MQASSEPKCDQCEAPATINLRKESSRSAHLFCEAHQPDLTPGVASDWEVMRWRMPRDNSCSRLLAQALDSPEHYVFRMEMCDQKLLGGEGACRYYLSVITGSDQFAIWDDELLANIRSFIVARTRNAASCFKFDSSTIEFVAPFLKKEFLNEHPEIVSAMSKREIAIDLLIRNPGLSEAEIADIVPTTIKQLRRNVGFRMLRSQIN